SIAWGVAGVTGAAALLIGGPLTGVITLSVATAPINFASLLHGQYRDRKVLARFERPDGVSVLTPSLVGSARILTDRNTPLQWSLSILRRRADVAVGRFAPSGKVFSDADDRMILTGDEAL